MKRFDDKDIMIKELLERELPKPRKNEWFTRKVINRLPTKARNYDWIEYLSYFIGGVIVGISWKHLISDFNFSVLTVELILKYAALIATTFALTAVAVYRIILRD